MIETLFPFGLITKDSGKKLLFNSLLRILYFNKLCNAVVKIIINVCVCVCVCSFEVLLDSLKNSAEKNSGYQDRHFVDPDP
jgi:hypothetical protein